MPREQFERQRDQEETRRSNTKVAGYSPNIDRSGAKLPFNPDVIPSGAIIAEKLTADSQNFTTDIKFSAVDSDTVEWTSGDLKLADGTVYNINSGNTGDISQETYIYFDGNSNLEVTTNFGLAVGDEKIFLCFANNSSDTDQDALFVPQVGVLGINETVIGKNSITTPLLKAGAVTTDKVETNAITAAKINVVDLFSQDITVGGQLKSDDFDRNNLIGWEIDGNTDTVEFYSMIINVSGANGSLNWDGTNLSVQGTISITGGSGISNLTDAGALATEDDVAYGDVTGTKPPADATEGADWQTNLSSIPARFGDDNSPSAAGLYMSPAFMGFHNGNGSTSGWDVYIDSSGEFGFTGDGSNYITWNGSTLEVTGQFQVNGGSTIAGTLTMANGGAVETSDFSSSGGTQGWQIDYNGNAVFNSAVVRNGTLEGTTTVPATGQLSFSGGDVVVGDGVVMDSGVSMRWPDTSSRVVASGGTLMQVGWTGTEVEIDNTNEEIRLEVSGGTVTWDGSDLTVPGTVNSQGSGVTSIGDLDDVSVPSPPSDNTLIIYNSGNSQYEDGSIVGGSNVSVAESGSNLEVSVSDESIDDVVNALLIGGTDISLSYDDINDSLTIDYTGTGGTSDEDIEDVVGALITAGANMTKDYQDSQSNLLLSVPNSNIQSIIESHLTAGTNISFDTTGSDMVINSSSGGGFDAGNEDLNMGGFDINNAGDITANAAMDCNNLFVANDAIIQGSLSKGSGSFLIDHPLDPYNKYLRHSFVESPDMKNIYDGIVKLNDEGVGVVKLPDYFTALNKDPVVHISAKGTSQPNLNWTISGRTLTIEGGEPNKYVSWQVTGTRKDPYAERNRIKVEEEKENPHLLYENVY